MTVWVACEEVEREPDPFVIWHGVCRTCLFKAEVQLARFPDDSHVRWLVGWLRLNNPEAA